MNQHGHVFDARRVPLLLGIVIVIAATACSLRARVEPSKNHTAGRLQKLADDGDPDAQFELGRAYFYGQGVAKDTNVAFRLFTTAANHGSLPAQTALAVMYLEGIGDVPRDLVAGTSWMRRAAGEGYPSAIARLGSMYMSGIGMKQDFAEGIKLLQDAAARDDAYAQAELGLAYLNGTGVVRNPKLGVSWLRRAAKQDPAAMEALAVCYDLGLGVERNPGEAGHWRELASQRAAKGSPLDDPLVRSFR
jgi:TPR repeat protein